MALHQIQVPASWPKPVYFMAKPDDIGRTKLCRQRQLSGIDNHYDPSRFHVTLLPLGDARHLTPELLARIDHAVAALSAGPFSLLFDRIFGSTLRGSAMRDAQLFQRELVRWLRAYGVPVPPYLFRPHVSLAYGDPTSRAEPVAPIGWRVEELLLVESVHGEGRHILLRRWPLMAAQQTFAF